MYLNYAGSQCATFGGLKLLTEASASPATLLFSSSHSELVLCSDWHRLIAEPTKFLKGKLKYSPTVTASFSAATSHLHKSDALGPWIAGIFDVKQTPGAWDGWGREMSYCEPCLTKFLEDHVWLWYLNERVQSRCMLARLVPGSSQSCLQRGGYRQRTAGRSHAIYTVSSVASTLMH
jgi:hypothetical protein